MVHRTAAALIGFLSLMSACASTQFPLSPARMPTTAVDARRQVLVTMTPAPTWVLRARTSAIARDFDLQPVYAWPLMSIEVHCVVYTIMDAREPSAVSEALASDPRVESAQPIHIFRVLGHSYNDPYYSLQHGLQAIHMGEAHRWATGKGVRVAVVDTGVDPVHPDLRDRIFRSAGYVEMNAPPTDAHGTAVAGIIAATANNEIGIVGVAPDAEILSLKACFQTGADEPAQCNSFALLMAMEAAIMERAHVLNLSLAGPHDPLLARLIAAATARGMTVVAACDEQLESVSFPASLDQVIAVRSVDLEGNLRGRTHKGRGHELAAPGVDVLTTVPGGGYDFVTGSSFAAAHLSGVVALLRERRPKLSLAEVVALLQSTGDFLPRSTTSENGIGPSVEVVNACAALAKLMGEESPCPDIAPPAFTNAREKNERASGGTTLGTVKIHRYDTLTMAPQDDPSGLLPYFQLVSF